MSKSNKPLLIVLSCTRNYGWVTRAFLEGNTRWADYIIIIDQMSTDGTREMCAEYGDKVIIVDDPDMNYKESTRAIMAFNKGREIAGDRDHIFFALDIDEVMPANWMQTGDGQRILNSKPGDEFSLHWANLLPDKKTFLYEPLFNPWQVQYKVFHDLISIEFCEVKSQMHVPLLPYVSYEYPPTVITDFYLLHFGIYNHKWNKYKMKYYRMLDIKQHRSKSLVSLCRTYSYWDEKSGEILPVKSEWLFQDFDIYNAVDVKSVPIFVQYMNEMIQQDGIKMYAKLDIWDDECCAYLNIDTPHRWYHQIFDTYINITQKNKSSFIVKLIDKILKLFV